MRLCQDMQNSDSNQFKCVFAHEERIQKPFRLNTFMPKYMQKSDSNPFKCV